MLFYFALLFNAHAQPPGWADGFIPSGFSNHIVAIRDTAEILIDNNPISPGDYIGAFYDSSGVLKCGGYEEWTGATIAVTVWADDVFSIGKDGFIAGETINWKIWKASDSTTIDVTPTYNINFGTPDSIFAVNGLSEITSLIGNSPTPPTYVYAIHTPEINIYPNPIHEQKIHISCNSLNEISIYTLDGKLLKSFTDINTKNISIDLPVLSYGTYLIQINKRLTKKILIH